MLGGSFSPWVASRGRSLRRSVCRCQQVAILSWCMLSGALLKLFLTMCGQKRVPSSGEGCAGEALPPSLQAAAAKTGFTARGPMQLVGSTSAAALAGARRPNRSL